MDMIIYEKDKERILEAFRGGEFDYLEILSERIERGFFKYIYGYKVLQKLAESYPSPRKKEEVPIWLYLVDDIMLRLHGQHGFAVYPSLLKCSGLVDALGPEIVKRKVDKETGDTILECKGFNGKNHYPRKTPCDQDYLRKLAKDTDVEKLQGWYNRDVVKCLKDLKAIDEEGIVIGDASYIFIPDNDKYENSCVMLFDKNNHPVGKDEGKKLTPEQMKKCKWRRCYKMVSLLHTTMEEDFYMYYGIRVEHGKKHECPILYDMVDEFVKAMGKGVMKTLILDRGFVDGKSIGRCKKDLEVDVVIPLKKNMDVYKDAWGLSKLKDIKWEKYEREEEIEQIIREVPEVIRRREEARQKTLAKKKAKEKKKKEKPRVVKTLIAGIKGFTSWSQCPIPLNVVLIRDIYSDGEEKRWCLITTKDFEDAGEIVDLYKKRTPIEERHRQIKLFWDLASFRSTAFSLVVNQIVFVALTYTLLQLYLLRLGRKELNKLTRPKLLRTLLPGGEYITIYYQNYFAFTDQYEYNEILLTLKEKARIKILKKSRKLRKELICNFTSKRGP